VSDLVLPPIAFGCSPLHGDRVADVRSAATAALALGYRLFDTAEAYGTEPLLGTLLDGEHAGVAIISKLWHTNHGRNVVRAACEGSLRRLRRESLELYLVHAPQAWAPLGPLEIAWPGSREELEGQLVPRDSQGRIVVAAVPLEETWDAMVDLRRRGLARAIGLANVGSEELERLRGAGLEDPAAVQVEVHPLRPAHQLIDYCRRRGIRVLAHTPLGGGRVLQDPRVEELASSWGWSPARLVLAWHRALGNLPVVGSRDPRHLRDNLAAFAGPVDHEPLAALDDLLATDRAQGEGAGATGRRTSHD